MLTLNQIDESADLRDFFLSSDNAMPTLSDGWFDLSRDLAKGDYYAICARESGAIRAILPFAISEDIGGGRVANSMPLLGSSGGVYFGAQGHDPELELELYAKLVSYVSQQECRALTIITNPFDEQCHVEALEENIGVDHRGERIGQVSFLEDRTGDILSLFAPRKRSNIRSALRSGVTVRVSRRKQDWDWVRTQHEERMRAISGIVKADGYFNWVAQALEEDRIECRLTIAEKGGQRLAGLFTMDYGRFTEYMTPVTHWDRRNQHGLELLIYESMQHSLMCGRTQYYFGGTWTTQDGLHRFKKQFGAVDRRYYYLTKVMDQSLYQMSSKELLSMFPYYYTLPFSALDER